MPGPIAGLGVEVELRAVAASRPERAAAFATAFGIPQVMATAEELLDDPAGIDLVDICAPNSLHAEWRGSPPPTAQNTSSSRNR